MTRGLVIVHVDGLGYDYLLKALAQGQMPFVRHLIEAENYMPLPYRVGLPSTTPFAQAGILFGDNGEIPSFRWWDKQSGLLVEFGGHSSFHSVAHKYFRDCEPLTADGAMIATCYSFDAPAAFHLAYREHNARFPARRHSVRHVLSSWLMNPLHVVDWLWRGLYQIGKANLDYIQTRLSGQPAARRYVISDMLEEIFLHQLTRFAVVQAMAENYPVIYGAFYAYDETAHAYGPDSDHAFRILRHIDNTIRRVAAQRRRQRGGREYELAVLSDHGQIETLPYSEKYHKHFADWIAEWLPTFEVAEHPGKRITPQALDGHVELTYSGGLAHLYFRDLSWRLQRGEIEERFPGLIDRVARAPGVECVLAREGSGDCLITPEGALQIGEEEQLSSGAREFLKRFDDPGVIARQLRRLNSFERSGDLIIFGKFDDGRQVNFENQVGGHGSMGGEQLHPFLLARREWEFDTSRVLHSGDLYPLLRNLRDRLTPPPPASRA